MRETNSYFAFARSFLKYVHKDTEHSAALKSRFLRLLYALKLDKIANFEIVESVKQKSSLGLRPVLHCSLRVFQYDFLVFALLGSLLSLLHRPRRIFVVDITTGDGSS